MDKMKELYDKVAASPELQVKFADIMKNLDKDNAEKTQEALIGFAKDAGYTVTIEEVQTFFDNLAEKQEGELCDAELDTVAGGKVEFNGDNVKHSLTSLGTYCVTLSIKSAIVGSDCSDKFWTC